jgi:ribosomal protein S17
MKLPIKPRDPRKGFFAYVQKVPKQIQRTKTLRVYIRQRLFLSKYKRFYYKYRKYKVHCQPEKAVNLKVNSRVFCSPCRKISATKSHIVV